MTRKERKLLLFIAERLSKLYNEGNNEKQSKEFERLRLDIIKESKSLAPTTSSRPEGGKKQL